MNIFSPNSLLLVTMNVSTDDPLLLPLHTPLAQLQSSAHCHILQAVKVMMYLIHVVVTTSLTVHAPATQIPVEESGFVHGVASSATDSLIANNTGFVPTAAHTSWLQTLLKYIK